MIALDTHIVIYALAGTLRPRERELLEAAAGAVGISDVVLWELAMLAARGRIVVDLDGQVVHDALASLHVWPIDLATARMARRLDFRGDPADELIAATSVVRQAPLLTRDARILGSRIVPLAAAT